MPESQLILPEQSKEIWRMEFWAGRSDPAWEGFRVQEGQRVAAM